MLDKSEGRCSKLPDCSENSQLLAAEYRSEELKSDRWRVTCHILSGPPGTLKNAQVDLNYEISTGETEDVLI